MLIQTARPLVFGWVILLPECGRQERISHIVEKLYLLLGHLSGYLFLASLRRLC